MLHTRHTPGKISALHLAGCCFSGEIMTSQLKISLSPTIRLSGVCVFCFLWLFFSFLQLVFQMLEPTCKGRLSTWKERKCVCRLLKYKSEVFLKAGLSPAGLYIIAAVLSANALPGVFRSESFGYFRGYIVPKKFHLKLTNLSHGLKCGIRNTNISISTEFYLPVSQMRAFSTP